MQKQPRSYRVVAGEFIFIPTLVFIFTEWAIYPKDCLSETKHMAPWHLMTKSLFDGHRLNTVYIPYHVWSEKWQTLRPL